MAPPKKPWFRMYCEVTGDGKIRSIPLDQRWVWVAVMSLARQSPIPGFLMVSEQFPCSDRRIADEANAPLNKTKAALKLMSQLGMIHRDPNLSCWVVTNFGRRQFESDDSTPRSRKARNATAMQRPINGDATDQSTESESDTERVKFQQQHESVPTDDVAAAALDLHIGWKASTAGVSNAAGFRRHLEQQHAADLAAYVLAHPDAAPLDVAVDVLGTPRPRPTLVEFGPTCACPTCDGTKLVEADTGGYRQCPACAGAGAVAL